MATLVSSAGGLLAMLNESHPLLKLHALSNLNNLVDNFWPEISTSVPIMYGIAFSFSLVASLPLNLLGSWIVDLGIVFLGFPLLVGLLINESESGLFLSA